MRQFITVISSFVFSLTTLLAQGGQLDAVGFAGHRIASALSLDGAGLSIVRANQELHRSLHRDFSAGLVIPISSASKWLAVATILTLVDDNTLDLDHPVARYVEEFDRDDRRRLTLRQCLSCTSGLPASMSASMRRWDMKRFADEAAGAPLKFQASAAFLYGDLGFQIVAVAAERATGKDWHTLFEERIGAPLGMRDTAFGTKKPLAFEPGKTALPWVGSGAVSTLNDYTRFVRLILAKGVWHGQRVLSEASVEEMLRDQVRPMIDVKSSVLHAKHVRYGLGTWIESLGDGEVRYSDPGALGFTPWIDPQLDLGGVFAVQDRAPRVLRNLERVHKAVRAAAVTPEVSGTIETVNMSYGGRVRRYHLHTPPHTNQHPGIPLLVVLHGEGSNGAQFRDVTNIQSLALEKGFAVVFPDGAGRHPKKQLSWNCGDVDVYASRQNVDDVGFIRKMVRAIQERVPVNAERVYAVGHGNGGMMCHRLAREAGDVFGGIAVVAGAMNFVGIDHSRPVATMLIHGDADSVVGIKGGRAKTRNGGVRDDASLQDAVDYYVERNGLVGYPLSSVDGGVRMDRYERSKGAAVSVPLLVVTLENGGHVWPGSQRDGGLVGERPFDWLASANIVSFFVGVRPLNGGLPTTPAVPR